MTPTSVTKQEMLVYAYCNMSSCEDQSMTYISVWKPKCYCIHTPIHPHMSITQYDTYVTKQEMLVYAYCNMSCENHSRWHIFQSENPNATVYILKFILTWVSCSMTSISVTKQEMLVYAYCNMSSC